MKIKAQMVEELARDIVDAALEAGYMQMACEHGWDAAKFELAQGDYDFLAGRQDGTWQDECEALLAKDGEAWDAMVAMVAARVRVLLAMEAGNVLRQDG